MADIIFYDGDILFVGGDIALSTDCCCDDGACVTDGEWTALLVDVDGQWGGNIDLGPHTLTWDAGIAKECDPDVGDGGWQVTFAAALACDPADVTLTLRCCNGEYDLDVNSSSGTIPWNTTYPFNFTGLIPVGGVITVSFTRSLFNNGVCWSTGGPYNWQIILTRV